MKKYIILASLTVIATLTLALTTFDQEPAKSSYVTVTCTTKSRTLEIFYGASKAVELVQFTKNDYLNDKVIDVLNDLENKGYQLVNFTSNTVSDNQGNYDYTNFQYTLRKK